MDPEIPKSLVGVVVDEVAFEIERGKIAEFARATFAADAIHRDPAVAAEAGQPAVLATPTYVVVAGHHRDQRAFVERLGLALERVVVGGVKWSYERPLAAGDSLRGVRRVVGDTVRTGSRGGTMRIVTLETEYRDASDQPVVRVEETLIERGAPQS